jgi:hypothetical protein
MKALTTKVMTIPGNKYKKGGQVVAQNQDSHSSAHTNNIEARREQEQRGSINYIVVKELS